MTVNSTTNFVSHAGNGATINFPFDFYVLEESHLIIQLQDDSTGAITKTYVNGEYTVTGIGEEAGGTVTILGTPIAAGFHLFIRRVVPYVQELDLVNQGGFYPDTVEQALDYKEMEIQQLSEVVDRSFTVPLGETIDPIPARSARVAKFLSFDADGNPIATSGLGADGGLREDLAASGGTALVAGPDGTLQDLLNARLLRVTSKASVKALNVTRYDAVLLDLGAGNCDVWVRSLGGVIAGDTLEGLSFLSNTVGHVWKRRWNQIEGYLEWFGGVGNDTSKRAENNAAFAAAFLLCPWVQMLNTDYYVSAPVIPNERTRLKGCGMDWDGSLGTGTRIITNQASGEIVLVGSKTYDGVSDLNTAPRSFYLSDFQVSRTGAMVGSDNDAVGVWLGFCLDVQVERVRVAGANTHGFACRGVVFGKLKECRAKRDVACSSGTDRWNGFLVDGSYLITGSATLTTINGNASLYIEGCQSEWNLADTASISMGMYFTSKGTDTFVDRFEATGGQYGIAWDGTGGTTSINSMNDCRVRGATCDQTTVASFYFNNLQQVANVRVIDGYGGATTGRGLLIQNCKGRVDFDGELYNVAGTSASVTVIGSRGAKVQAFSWEATVHAEIGNSIGCDLDIYASSTSRTCTSIIDSIGSNSRNRYKVSATGAAAKISKGIRSFVGSAPYNVNNDYNSYDVTAITGLDVVSATTDFAASQEAASVKVGV